MFRPSASRRWVLGSALVLLVALGAGLSAASLRSVPDPAVAPAASLASPASPATPAPPRLTLEEVKAVALEVAPGRVVEVDEDIEPSGIRYEVTVRHDDRTSTDVEVDGTTGRVTGIDHDDDRD